MHDDDAFLAALLRRVPRRYRPPALPDDPAQAAARGTDVALAWAIEAARAARLHDTAPPAAAKALFTGSLAGLVRAALDPQRGDPAFQALTLRAREPDVDAHVRLAAQAPADRRTVRTLVDAVAHPGKTRHLPDAPPRHARATLHRLATDADWPELRRVVAAMRASLRADDPALDAALRRLDTEPGLTRLAHGAALSRRPPVQRFVALCERLGPVAGSDAAAANGRASARLGARAEAACVDAFRAIAGALDERASGGPYRVVRGLRTPRGFPPGPAGAKDEWDVALLRVAGGDDRWDVVLLAEVKASPSAAVTDVPRLLRGLQRLARARADADFAFASADGEARICGASLRRLAPHGDALPSRVIYCCSADTGAMPPVMSAASKSLLSSERCTLAFAAAIERGESPPHDALDPVWDALSSAPRLRAVLHQYDTARRACDAMVHPDDLRDAVTACRPR